MSQEQSETLQSLIEAVINGDATAQQQQRLEERLVADPAARTAYLQYVNLHAGLHRRFLAGDAASAPEEKQAPVVAKQATLAWKRTLMVALAVLPVLLLAGWWLYTDGQSRDERMKSPVIAQAGPAAFITSAGGEQIAAEKGAILRPGESVVTSTEDGRVVLRYEDGAEIIALGSTRLSLEPSRGRGKRLKLDAGMISAKVTPQPSHAPLIIETPHTSVRVVGTQFALAADARAGTRLELESGRVELLHGDDERIAIEAGSIAIVQNAQAPVQVSPRPLVVTTPDREVVFRGLRSIGYSGDGGPMIGATRWQAFYWHDDERLEVVPLHENGKKGIDLRLQHGANLVYYNRTSKELVNWDATTRQPVDAFRKVADLKRQFRKTESRTSDWNPAGHIAAISPQDNWLAFQVGREFRVWRVEKKLWAAFAKDYDRRFVSALAGSPDGRLLAIAVRRDRLDLVEIATGKVTATWPLKHEVPFSMDFSRSGRLLAASFAGRVAVYDVEAGNMVNKFEEPGLAFLRISVSAQERFVAASTPSGQVWLWDIVNNQALPVLETGAPVRGLEFAPDSDELTVLAPGGRVTLWDISKYASAPSR